jgi:putative toxin-antitoxin system antitoxin component (TIGR02293 family)
MIDVVPYGALDYAIRNREHAIMPGTALPPNVVRLREHLRRGTRPQHFYVALLGLRTYDSAALHEKVGQGLSFEAMEKLRRALACSASQFATLIGIPGRTLARRKEAKRLEPDESDRLLRLARIVGLALQLFEGGLDEARAWLFAPHTALDNRSPIEFAGTEVGAREVENLIGRLEHGIPL